MLFMDNKLYKILYNQLEKNNGVFTIEKIHYGPYYYQGEISHYTNWVRYNFGLPHEKKESLLETIETDSLMNVSYIISSVFDNEYKDMVKYLVDFSGLEEKDVRPVVLDYLSKEINDKIKKFFPKMKLDKTKSPITESTTTKINLPKSILTPNNSGESIVKEALNIVRQIGLGDDVTDFLVRVAKVESCFGKNKSAFNTSRDSIGIWQTDKNSAFKQTRENRSILKRARNMIKDKIGLNWMLVPYTSLSKPLYSAIAARLYLLTISSSVPKELTNKITQEEVDKKYGGKWAKVPDNLLGMSGYWKKYYNTDYGKGSIEDFESKDCSDY